MAGTTNTAPNKNSNVESNMELAYTDEHFPSKTISSTTGKIKENNSLT